MNGGTIEMRNAGIERASEKMKRMRSCLSAFAWATACSSTAPVWPGIRSTLDHGVVAGALDRLDEVVDADGRRVELDRAGVGGQVDRGARDAGDVVERRAR